MAEHKINCTTFLAHMFNLSSFLPNCKTQTEGENTFELLKLTMKSFIEDSEVFGCPMPCELSTFKPNLVYTHKNSIDIFKGVSYPEDEFPIFVYYESADVEELEERLLVSSSALLGAIGGYMGLLLGVSCLSIFLGFLKCLEEKFTKKISNTK
jgi:hypothetical protein